MTVQEFSDQFDVLYNNITSNQAPGLNEYEKSVFLTKAQNEIVKNYFTANSKGNNIGQGFDDSAKRQADFSCLMMTSTCNDVSVSGKLLCENEGGSETTAVDPNTITFNSLGEGVPVIGLSDLIIGTKYTVTYTDNNINVLSTDAGAARINNFPYQGGSLTRCATYIASKIDPRSFLFSFPTDTFIIINESIYTTKNTILQVVPLRYDEYLRLMSKPFKRPLKNQAWRLLNYGTGSAATSSKYVEIITNMNDTVSSYSVRYIRTPLPIILSPLDGLSIGGYIGTGSNGELLPADSPAEAKSGIACELDPVLHEEILQRAVELAKVAWTSTGQDNTQAVIQAGQRSE